MKNFFNLIGSKKRSAELINADKELALKVAKGLGIKYK